MISATPAIGRAPASLVSPSPDLKPLIGQPLIILLCDWRIMTRWHLTAAIITLPHGGQKLVGGDNTTIDTDAVIAVIMAIL